MKNRKIKIQKSKLVHLGIDLRMMMKRMKKTMMMKTRVKRRDLSRNQPEKDNQEEISIRKEDLRDREERVVERKKVVPRTHC